MEFLITIILNIIIIKMKNGKRTRSSAVVDQPSIESSSAIQANNRRGRNKSKSDSTKLDDKMWTRLIWIQAQNNNNLSIFKIKTDLLNFKEANAEWIKEDELGTEPIFEQRLYEKANPLKDVKEYRMSKEKLLAIGRDVSLLRSEIS